MGTSETVGAEAVTRVYTVRLGNIAVWAVGLGVLYLAEQYYHPSVAVDVLCSGFYGYWTVTKFPWVSVRVEE